MEDFSDLLGLPIWEDEEFESDFEDEEFEAPNQIFQEHEILSERFRKTLYYGQMPINGNRFSLSMTKFCVDQFNGIGLEALEYKLNKLDMLRAAEITRNTYASPTSLILALIYLERLRNTNPAYLHSVSSTDLFLISLMVASKFLHDDGEEDEVFNDDWAASVSMEIKDLNTLEIDFLVAIEWRVFASNEDFQRMTHQLESVVASRQIHSRGWATYSDLLVLSRNLQLERLWTLLAECTFKVTAVCASAYAASLMTLLGTCYILSKTPLSPNNVQNSVSTIYSSFKPSALNKCEGTVTEFEQALDDQSDLNQVSQIDAASFIIASLPSAVQDTAPLSRIDPGVSDSGNEKNWTWTDLNQWSDFWLKTGTGFGGVFAPGQKHCLNQNLFSSKIADSCSVKERAKFDEPAADLLTLLAYEASGKHNFLSQSKLGLV